MPSWILNVYNKDGSTLVGSGQLDQTYRVTDTGIVDMTSGGNYMNVAFSNSNVIGYSRHPNQTIPEFHIGSTDFGFSAVGTYNIYEVEGDKYSITTSIPSITINCKDKTMEKDLQITFSGVSGTCNVTLNVETYEVTDSAGISYSVDDGNTFEPIYEAGIIELNRVSTIIFEYIGMDSGVPGPGSYCHVGTTSEGINIINANDSEYFSTITTPNIKPNEGDVYYINIVHN